MTMKKDIKPFFKYVSLNVLGLVGVSCYILADTFFISKALGTVGLTALNFTLPVFSLIMATGGMLGVGGSTRFSILKAQNRNEEGNIYFTHTLIAAAAASLVFVFFGIFFSRQIASLMGASGENLKMAAEYLKVILLFSPLAISNLIIQNFVRNDFNPKFSMLAMLAGSAGNILFDYIFIFPCNMGMFGAALATGFSPFISLCILSIHFIKKKNTFKPVKIKYKLKKSLDIKFLGMSAFIAEISSGIVIVVFNMLILRLEGDVGVAAYGVVANIALVVASVYNGIAQGIQPIVSRSYGCNNRKSCKNILTMAVILGFAVSLIIYLCSTNFNTQIITVFNSENNIYLQNLTIRGIDLYFIGFFFSGFNIILCAFLSAMETPKPAFILSIMRGLLLIIPIAVIMSSIFKMDGVWLSFTITEFITAIVGIFVIIINKKLRYGKNNEGAYN